MLMRSEAFREFDRITEEIGDQVEVHTKFSDSWGGGFEIAEIVAEGYRVRRKSDGSLLPGYTSESDLRPSSL